MALTDVISGVLINKIKTTIKTQLTDRIDSLKDKVTGMFTGAAIKSLIFSALDHIQETAKLTSNEFDDVAIKIFKDGLAADDNYELLSAALLNQLGIKLVPSGDGEPLYAIED